MLTKARANVAVVATTFVGFALHADIRSNWLLLLHAMVGTGLLAGAATMANQAMEHQFDRNMARTRNRPIAAGRLRRRSGIWLSSALFGAGVLWLGTAVNVGTMLLGGLAFLIYVLAYTPLKRRTPSCTLVGAVSGAIPLLMGWAATGAEFGLWSIVPFAILFLWQIPHFLAIAWWRRADYIDAGYRVLPHEDRRGYRTAGWALVFAMAVFAVSLAPAAANRVTYWYWLGVVAAGFVLIFSAVRFLLRRDEAAARSLFLASLYYLPAVYSLMLLCRES